MAPFVLLVIGKETSMEFPECNDSRNCRFKNERVKGRVLCKVLNSTYKKDGRCPFCKEVAREEQEFGAVKT